MKIEKIDHICFAVRSVEEVRKIYEEHFGLIPKYEYVAESEKIRVIRYVIGDVGVEFMEPTSDDSEVAKFIKRRGEGPYLIAYKVDNLDGALKELRSKGVELIDEKPREIFGTRYAFIHHPRKLHGVLTELIEGEFRMEENREEKG